jgi:predicted membrane chloride channel (bestrophin family)
MLENSKVHCVTIFGPHGIISLSILLYFAAVPSIQAFSNGVSRQPARFLMNPLGIKHLSARRISVFNPIQGILSYKPVEDAVEDDLLDEGWLRWMSGGKPRGTDTVETKDDDTSFGAHRSDRYSSSDWFHNTVSLPNSAILKAIRFPVFFMTSWATFISALYLRLLATKPSVAKCLVIPSTPHSLMVSALGLLLVFRTNSAYQRFVEGRQIWENIVNASRDLYRMCMLYEQEMGLEKRRRMQRLLAAFPYLLRHRIRPNLVMRRLNDEQYQRDPENSILLYQDAAALDTDPVAAAVATEEEETGKSRRKTRPLYWVDKRTLPWRLLPPGCLEQCARAQNRPLWVVDRMAKELRTIPDGPTFTARERLALIKHTEKLSKCIGACERIHQTVVPLNYARHSLRSLTLWLLSLPFALIKDLGLLTGPVLFLVSWLLFGVYEIGYSIEDPFQGTLRLSILCDTVRRDVLADEFLRETAFFTDLDGEEDDDEEYESESPEDVENLDGLHIREYQGNGVETLQDDIILS